MKTKDKELLKIYMKGFDDELYGKTSTVYNEDIKNRAYSIGANHAVLGDDVRSFDYLTSVEILELIKYKEDSLREIASELTQKSFSGKY